MNRKEIQKELKDLLEALGMSAEKVVFAGKAVDWRKGKTSYYQNKLRALKAAEQKAQEENKQELALKMMPGKYVLTFHLHLYFKDRKIEMAKLVTETVHLEQGETRQDVLSRIISQYVQQNYHESSVEVTGITDIEVRDFKNLDLTKLPLMASNHLAHKLIPDCEINTTPDQRALDYLVAHTAQVKGFKSWNREKLKEFFGRTDPCALEILRWAEHVRYTSVYVLDMFHQAITHHLAATPKLTLVFEVNNNHLYPVLAQHLKQQVYATRSIALERYKFDVLASATQFDSIDRHREAEILQAKFKHRVVLVDGSDDLSELACKVTEHTNIMPTHINYLGSKVTMFEHPTTNHIFVAAPPI